MAPLGSMKMSLKAKMTSTCFFGMNGLQETQEVQSHYCTYSQLLECSLPPTRAQKCTLYIGILAILIKAHLPTQPNAYQLVSCSKVLGKICLFK